MGIGFYIDTYLLIEVLDRTQHALGLGLALGVEHERLTLCGRLIVGHRPSGDGSGSKKGGDLLSERMKLRNKVGKDVSPMKTPDTLFVVPIDVGED
jgi:hypothetical protein